LSSSRKKQAVRGQSAMSKTSYQNVLGRETRGPRSQTRREKSALIIAAAKKIKKTDDLQIRLERKTGATCHLRKTREGCYSIRTTVFPGTGEKRTSGSSSNLQTSPRALLGEKKKTLPRAEKGTAICRGKKLAEEKSSGAPMKKSWRAEGQGECAHGGRVRV